MAHRGSGKATDAGPSKRSKKKALDQILYPSTREKKQAIQQHFRDSVGSAGAQGCCGPGVRALALHEHGQDPTECSGKDRGGAPEETRFLATGGAHAASVHRPDAAGDFVSLANKVDLALTELLNQCFQDGLDISEAMKFFAAVLEAFPVVGKTGLTRAKRALKGCKNVDPGQARTPLAWRLVSLIAMTMWGLQQHVEAVFILTMFSTYARPSELLATKNQDLVQSRHLGMSWAINLNNSESMSMSKTGVSDESILLDTFSQISRTGSATLQDGRPAPARVCVQLRRRAESVEAVVSDFKGSVRTLQ